MHGGSLICALVGCAVQRETEPRSAGMSPALGRSTVAGRPARRSALCSESRRRGTRKRTSQAAAEESVDCDRGELGPHVGRAATVRLATCVPYACRVIGALSFYHAVGHPEVRRSRCAPALVPRAVVGPLMRGLRQGFCPSELRWGKKAHR